MEWADKIQYPESQTGGNPQKCHNRGHRQTACPAAAFCLVLNYGDTGFCQEDGRGQCSKKHQQEKDDADYCAESHGIKNFGQCDEHQAGTFAQGGFVASGKDENGRGI